MKKNISLLIATITLLLAAYCGYAQHTPFTGQWHGNIGPQVRLIFHLKDNNGAITGTLDSPDQGARGIAISHAETHGDSIVITMEAIKSTYRAKRMNDTTLGGLWQQSGASLPLSFIKKNPAENSTTINRPQTPGAPVGYTAREVVYNNADNTVRLAGTLTIPHGKGPFAAVVLISGSGQQDRDETIFDHKPFAVLADHLTKKGLAVMRVDDRGTGGSTGEVMAATSAHFANDVRTSIAYLKKQPGIDAKRIGLIGHSEGGMIAPMVAAENPDVHFMVLWAAPIIGGLQTNVAQNAAALARANIQPAAINAFKNLHSHQLQHLATATDTAALRQLTLATFTQWKQQQPDSILQALYVKDHSIVGQNVVNMYRQLYQLPWMRFFINYQPAADLAKFRGKLLAINGTRDVQVDAAANLAIIDSICASNKAMQCTTLRLNGLNHLLQPAVTGEVNEYKQIETTIDPAALNAIAGWLVANVIKPTP